MPHDTDGYPRPQIRFDSATALPSSTIADIFARLWIWDVSEEAIQKVRTHVAVNCVGGKLKAAHTPGSWSAQLCTQPIWLDVGKNIATSMHLTGGQEHLSSCIQKFAIVMPGKAQTKVSTALAKQRRRRTQLRAHATHHGRDDRRTCCREHPAFLHSVLLCTCAMWISSRRYQPWLQYRHGRRTRVSC